MGSFAAPLPPLVVLGRVWGILGCRWVLFGSLWMPFVCSLEALQSIINGTLPIFGAPGLPELRHWSSKWAPGELLCRLWWSLAASGGSLAASGGSLAAAGCLLEARRCLLYASWGLFAASYSLPIFETPTLPGIPSCHLLFFQLFVYIPLWDQNSIFVLGA